MLRNRAVVYLFDGSAAFLKMLHTSIRTLRHHNQDIEIVVLNTGTPVVFPVSFQPVVQKQVCGRFGQFPDDKYLIGLLTEYDHVIMVDCDTFVLADIEGLFDAGNEDVLARESWTYQSDRWSETYNIRWKENLALLGIDSVPVLNTGVVIFKNRSHVTVREKWIDLLLAFKSGHLIPVYGGKRLFEQLSFSLAVADLGLQVGFLNSLMHCYAWNNERNPETVVYHTTSKWYEKLRIEEW